MSRQSRHKWVESALKVLVLTVFVVIFGTVWFFPGTLRVLGSKSKKLSSTNTLPAISTVFLIVMENHAWSQIKGSTSAPYINNTLLPMASYATEYYDSGIHPSLPNYLWLDAGTNFGLSKDCLPKYCSQNSTGHLEDQLISAGLTWKAYEEDISGTLCPLTNVKRYDAKHNPNLYFKDDTGTLNTKDAYCIAHNVPLSHLATDLANNTVSNYNYLGPNACDDMHNISGCTTRDAINNGDTWLSNNIPPILNSQAYQNGGVIIITWDEGNKTNKVENDGPIGLIVLSPYAKGGGYNNTISYTHSSTLRTIEEFFNLPLLGDAANATDLSDLFVPPPITPTPTSTDTPAPTSTDSATT